MDGTLFLSLSPSLSRGQRQGIIRSGKQWTPLFLPFDITFPRVLNERNIVLNVLNHQNCAGCDLRLIVKKFIFIYHCASLLTVTMSNLGRNNLSGLKPSSSYSNYYFPLHAPPSPVKILGRMLNDPPPIPPFSITGRDRWLANEDQASRIGAVEKEPAHPRGMHAFAAAVVVVVVVSDKRGWEAYVAPPEGSVPCATHPPPLGRASVPLLWYP